MDWVAPATNTMSREVVFNAHGVVFSWNVNVYFVKHLCYLCCMGHRINFSKSME